MTAENDDWPTYAEVLGRKTLETLDHWLTRHRAKIITTREFYLVVSTLYTTTVGIVPRDVSELLSQIDKELTNAEKIDA